MWNEYLDVDKSGTLNDNEVRNLAVHINTLPLPPNIIENTKDLFRNCTYNRTQVWEFEPRIDLNSIEECTPIREALKKHFSKKTKNKSQFFLLKIRHESLDSDDVGFIMVGTNSTNVEKALDGIREKRHKFICLNDNINHTNPEAPKVKFRFIF